jgi:hypothetical protein
MNIFSFTRDCPSNILLVGPCIVDQNLAQVDVASLADAEQHRLVARESRANRK